MRELFLSLLLILSSIGSWILGLYTIISRKFAFKNGVEASESVAIIIGMLFIILAVITTYYIFFPYRSKNGK